jgi:rhodanese-related sulfurtransferase
MAVINPAQQLASIVSMAAAGLASIVPLRGAASTGGPQPSGGPTRRVVTTTADDRQPPLENGDQEMRDELPEIPAGSVPDDALLLDVREPEEWAAGHAPDARHIPLGQLGARAGEIPQGEAVYVICRSGGRSAHAARALTGGGWQAINVAGGMQDWAAAGRPMVTDSGAEPYVA